MNKKYDAESLQKEITKGIDIFEKKYEFPNIFYETTKKGTVGRKQFQKLEYKKFNVDWIVMIESFFPSLDKIMRNLRSSLKYETEILPVEKTRRTSPESIRHLIQNTRYIREIVDGEVIPEKVLNNLSEIEYGIYENRFIMTLVSRLYDYLLNRIGIIKENLHGYKETVFNLSNQFKLNGSDYDASFNLKAIEEMELNEVDIENQRLLDRVQEDFKIVSRMYHSEFMRIMLRYKPVKPPIMKTQIILKNPDFKNAYLLWLYLDKIHDLDYSLKTEIKNKRFNKNYHKELDQSLLLMFSTIFANSNLGNTGNGDQVIKKTTKVKHEQNDYSENALLDTNPYDLEPQLATEYYLKKAKAVFGKHIKELQQNSSSEKVAIKQILIDQYAIADQVFEYYFQTNQDNDVFQKLVLLNDPVKKFDDVLKKYSIAKIAREVKEKLYKESFTLESKWITEIEESQDKAIEYLKEKGYKETDNEIVNLNNALSKELANYEKGLAAQNKAAYNKEKEKMNLQIRQTKKKYSDQLKSFKDKEKLKLAAEKAVIKEKRKAKREQIKIKNRKAAIAAKEREKKRKAREMLKAKKALQAKKEKETAKNKLKIAMEKAKK
ncbi:MAG: hypothetical protein WCS56_00455 [Bacilli bacterium]